MFLTPSWSQFSKFASQPSVSAKIWMDTPSCTSSSQGCAAEGTQKLNEQPVGSIWWMITYWSIHIYIYIIYLFIFIYKYIRYITCVNYKHAVNQSQTRKLKLPGLTVFVAKAIKSGSYSSPQSTAPWFPFIFLRRRSRIHTGIADEETEKILSTPNNHNKNCGKQCLK